jgi:hypothetical protein
VVFAQRAGLAGKFMLPRQLQIEKVPMGYFGIMNSYWTRIAPLIVPLRARRVVIVWLRVTPL